LFAIVESKVKPERMQLKDNPDGRRRKEYWWHWGRFTPALDAATRGLSRVLAHAYVSPHLAFTFVPPDYVVAGPQNIFAFESYPSFCVLQSRVHEAWARFFASTLKNDLSYTRSDCFETFPFPINFANITALQDAGRLYFELRAVLMVKNNDGLTKTYNRFHDPLENDSSLGHLRQLHDVMDRAVLDAYGWTDIEPECEFVPEFNDEEEEVDGGRPKRKKYRYRWTDEIRDEVLARLLELNSRRALEEGQVEAPLKQKKAKKNEAVTPLFDE
jgi:hypothetical protein